MTTTNNIFTVQPTKRIKRTGARQEIIRLIKEANPGTVYETLDWNDFAIAPQVYLDDGDLDRRSFTATSFPVINVFVTYNSRKKYHPDSHGLTTFNVANAPHINDVFTNIFGTTEFSGVEYSELLNKLREYIPEIQLNQVGTENDGSTTIYKLHLRPYAYSENNAQELSYLAFVDCSETVKPLLTIKLHASEDLIRLDLNNPSTNKDIEYNNQDIYENV